MWSTEGRPGLVTSGKLDKGGNLCICALAPFLITSLRAVIPLMPSLARAIFSGTARGPISTLQSQIDPIYNDIYTPVAFAVPLGCHASVVWTHVQTFARIIRAWVRNMQSFRCALTGNEEFHEEHHRSPDLLCSHAGMEVVWFEGSSGFFGETWRSCLGSRRDMEDLSGQQERHGREYSVCPAFSCIFMFFTHDVLYSRSTPRLLMMFCTHNPLS